MFKKLFFISLFVAGCATNNLSPTSNADLFTGDISNVKPRREYKSYNYSLITGKMPVEWNTEEGQKRFNETEYKKPFFALAHHFSRQLYPTSCGPAVGRIILSAIYERTNTRFLLDKDNSIVEKRNGMEAPLFSMTERNIFNVYKGEKDGTYDENKDYDVIIRHKKRKNGRFGGGISLQDLGEVIALHPNTNVKWYPVKIEDLKPERLNDFRKILKQTMSSGDNYMIVNYHLSAMYSFASGHYSIVSAYNERTDSVLLMDVAGHLGTWTWIDIKDLYRLMNSVVDGTPRGYMIVSIDRDKK